MLFVSYIFYFFYIKWKNCFIKDIGNRVLVCIDDVHIKVTEPSAFNKAWNSHKLKGAAVAYEIATCIMTGDIVAFNRPFPARKWPGINIFRNKTKTYLLPGEKVLGDLSYK